MSYGNNQYPPQQQGYGGQQQQPQGQGDFWPNVTGFKIGPSKKGTGHTITFTINSFQKGKNTPMLFQQFMEEVAKAFQESGGNGVRFIIPFRDGNGPRGPFQSASIGIMPNVPQQNSFGGQGGGGRRDYPPRQAQGYGQPQQNGYPQQGPQGGYQGPTQGMAPTQPSVPMQQGYPQQPVQQPGPPQPFQQGAYPQAVPQPAPQAMPQGNGYAPQAPQNGGQIGSGQTAPQPAYPSNNGPAPTGPGFEPEF